MKNSRRTILAALLALGVAGGAAAQSTYPTKAITIIVPFGAGGIADITARSFGQVLSTILKQPVVIDNRPSAGNIVGSAAVAKAAPDGYTLLLMSNGNAVSTGLFKKLPYDPVKDFAPIATLGYFDLAMFVDAKSKFKTAREVLDFAKANPGKLSIGTIAVGSTQNLSAELFKTQAGIDALIVPYNGTPAVQTALRGAQVDVAFEILGPMIAQVGPEGGLRALAVSSDQRFAGLSSVPTLKESGLPNYDVSSWNALVAPVGTPKDVIAKLNAAVGEAAKNPELQARMQALGVRTQSSTPEQLDQLLKAEIKRWGDVIVQARIQPQ
ncbi:tripartite tricarboxylate transporter substrate binding protein [soil metagenome]